MVYVIVPVYNGEKQLRRCLDSILNSSLQKTVVCINDGSTDSSSQILQFYEQNYDFIILNQQNMGPSAARNAGLDYVFGKCNDNDLISFVDADDFVDSDYFAKSLNLLIEKEADILCSSYILESSTKQKYVKHVENEQLLNGIEATSLLLQDETVQSHSHCKLFKAFTWKNVRFPVDIVSMEDQATIFKCFLNANKVFITNYAGYHYWQGDTSICRSPMTNKKISDSLLGYLESVKFLLGVNKDDEKRKCLQSAINGFSACYLMLIPRVDYEKESIYLDNIKKVIEFEKKNKLVSKSKPHLKKEKLKKFVYLLNKRLYNKVYRIYIK